VIAVVGRDSRGNRVAVGGAKLQALIKTFGRGAVGGPAAPEVAPLDVLDRHDGTYEIACDLKAACDFEVHVPRPTASWQPPLRASE
jgi:hypothetical protein